MSFFRDLLESVVPTAYAEEVCIMSLFIIFFEHVTVVLDGLSLQAISVILTLHYIFFVQPVEDVEVEQPEDAPEEEVSEETVEEEDDDDEEDDEDDEDEEEEETADPLDTLREECTKTAACKPFDHHFHECIERVTKEQKEPDYEHKHYKEDCIEEFFHLQHCVNDCVAPRLFNRLK